MENASALVWPQDPARRFPRIAADSASGGPRGGSHFFLGFFFWEGVVVDDEVDDVSSFEAFLFRSFSCWASARAPLARVSKRKSLTRFIPPLILSKGEATWLTEICLGSML